MKFRTAVAAALLVVGCAVAPQAAADPASPTPSPGPLPGPPQGPPPGPAQGPPPGPKTSFGDGTYTVGTDIAPGVYQSAGPVEGGVCYWKRSNGAGTVANAMTKKPQIVQIEAGDTTFKSSECQDWQKTDAAPPPDPSPLDVLGQLGSLAGAGVGAGGTPAPSGG